MFYNEVPKRVGMVFRPDLRCRVEGDVSFRLCPGLKRAMIFVNDVFMVGLIRRSHHDGMETKLAEYFSPEDNEEGKFLESLNEAASKAVRIQAVLSLGREHGITIAKVMFFRKGEKKSFYAMEVSFAMDGTVY